MSLRVEIIGRCATKEDMTLELSNWCSAQVVSTSTHWSKGNVDRELVGFAVLGALVGGFAGGSVAALLPERALRLIFATWRI